MKPIGTNNMSAWGYVGLFILFSLPGIGGIALILVAILGSGDARNFARALIIFAVILYAALFVLGLIGLFHLDSIMPDTPPNLLPNQGDLELFINIPSLIG